MSNKRLIDRLPMRAKFPGVDFLGTALKFRKRKKIS